MSSNQRPENPFVSLIFSVVLPSFILSKLSGPEQLGPVKGLIVALSFPIAYSIWDFLQRRHISFISGLGFISILLTGAFSLYELPANWIAVKEAAVPSLIGLAILISMRTKSPLVKKLLYNDNVINVDVVDDRLVTTQHKLDFEKLMNQSSYLLASSFLVSAILNYGLAKVILQSPVGTPEFNQELGRMNYLSYPVIVLPSMLMMGFALYRLMKGIKVLTGLEMDEILKTQNSQAKTEKKG